MKLNLTDANGKKFNVSLSDIADMSCDHSFTNNDSSARNFTISVKDSEGKDLELSSIIDAAKKDTSSIPDAIDVTFEATHSGDNKNHAIYHSDSMEKDAVSWMDPFARPLIKNHYMDEEPMGRVVNYLFRQSKLNPERDCVEVTWRVTDKDAIPKFLDGRYKTMSIGASGGLITCNHCGKTILKDGKVTFCGHWRGETYDNKVCKWNVRDMEYKEGSIVNAPADNWAQAVDINVVSNDDKDDDETDNAKGGNSMKDLKDKEQLDDNKTYVETALDVIDSILKDTKSEDPEGDEDEAEDKDDNEDSSDDGDDSDDNADDSGSDDDAEDSANQLNIKDELAVRLQDELDALKDQLSKVTTLEEDKLALETKVIDLEAKVHNLQEELKVSDEEMQDFRAKAIKMAYLNKEQLANRIADHKVILDECKLEDRETLVTELRTKSAKELNDELGSVLASVQDKKFKTRTLVNVVSPGMVNMNDKNSINDDQDDNKNNTKPAEPTMADLENTVIDIFSGSKNTNKEEF